MKTFTREQNIKTCINKRRFNAESAEKYIQMRLEKKGMYLRAYQCLGCGFLHMALDKEAFEKSKQTKENV